MKWILLADHPPEAGEYIIYHTIQKNIGRGNVYGDPDNQFVKDTKDDDIILFEEISHWISYLPQLE